jgi:hypothetical protein
MYAFTGVYIKQKRSMRMHGSYQRQNEHLASSLKRHSCDRPAQIESARSRYKVYLSPHDRLTYSDLMGCRCAGIYIVRQARFNPVGIASRDGSGRPRDQTHCPAIHECPPADQGGLFPYPVGAAFPQPPSLPFCLSALTSLFPCSLLSLPFPFLPSPLSF